MADDNAVDMTSDGDDDQGDILPPTKKYKWADLHYLLPVLIGPQSPKMEKPVTTVQSQVYMGVHVSSQSGT